MRVAVVAVETEASSVRHLMREREEKREERERDFGFPMKGREKSGRGLLALVGGA